MKTIKTFYNNLKIKPKLLISFSVIIMVLLVIVSITFYSLQKLDTKQKDLTESFKVADDIMEMKFTISQDLTLLMEIMTSDTKEELDDFWKEHTELITRFNDQINTLTLTLNDEYWGEEYEVSKENLKEESILLSALYKDKIQTTIQRVYELRAELLVINVNSILEDIIQTAAKDSNIMNNATAINKTKSLNETITRLDSQADSLGSEMFKVFAALEDSTHIIVDKSRLSSQQVASSSKTASVIFSLIGLLVSVVLGVFIAIRISKPIIALSGNVKKLEQGNFPEELEIKEHDEVGFMINAINSLTRTLKKIALFAQDVGNNKLDVEAEFNSEGVLGHSLINMRNSLKKVSQEDTKRNWVTMGIAQFSDLLRTEQEDVKELGDTIISKLVKYTNSNQGSLFILNEENEKESYLELLSCYAWNRKKYDQKRLAIGEGMVGQAVQEKEYIYLTDVPDNYINITSGLGDSNPKSILIMPMKLNEEVLGVIELASLNHFEQHQIDFVQKIGESIASTIKTAKINIRTKKLLAESQSITEELKSQEEEMRQNMEEMQATHEEMQRKEKEMKRLLAQADEKEEKLKQSMEDMYAKQKEMELLQNEMKEAKEASLKKAQKFREQMEKLDFELEDKKAQIQSQKKLIEELQQK